MCHSRLVLAHRSLFIVRRSPFAIRGPSGVRRPVGSEALTIKLTPTQIHSDLCALCTAMIGILVFSRGILERKRNAGFCGCFPGAAHHASRGITKRRLDLSIIAPGRCAARMPTGPLRRSSVPARRRAIVGKSRVEPDRLHTQRLSLWFWRWLASSPCL